MMEKQDHNQGTREEVIQDYCTRVTVAKGAQSAGPLVTEAEAYMSDADDARPHRREFVVDGIYLVSTL